MAARKRTLLLLSDLMMFRQTLATVVGSDAYQVNAQATTAPIRKARPEIALVDLDHALSDTKTLVDALHAQLPDTRFLHLGSAVALAAASHDGATMIELPRAELTHLRSALGGRTPSPSSALVRAREQWSHVTARQRDVMRWLAAGYDNPGIAAKLRVGTRAIKAHISALLALFGLDSRTQLALLATDGGLKPLK
jgi:DNA-binding NarL/FixJ family response regulator